MATQPSRDTDSDDPGESILPALREELQRTWQRRKARLPQWQHALAVVAFVFIVWSGFRFWNAQHRLLEVTMLDVGQGESLLIRSPQNRTVLIDGGGDPNGMRANVGQSVIVPFLQTRGISHIDVLVITHADADHCNGLLTVLREIPVGLIVDGAIQGNLAATDYLKVRAEIAKRNIPIMPAQAGQKLNLGEATITVLAPLLPLQQGGMNDDNNNAAVLRLDYGKTSLLFTADVEQETEERLVRSGANLKCTILKVGHHGSQTSTSPLFLQQAQPEAAIISCGRYNRFGHPAVGVLQRLSEQKAGVYRTDLDGAIEITSDGQNSWIQTTR